MQPQRQHNEHSDSEDDSDYVPPVDVANGTSASLFMPVSRTFGTNDFDYRF